MIFKKTFLFSVSNHCVLIVEESEDIDVELHIRLHMA